MMERLEVTNDPANIGYYSGLVDSAFAFTQMFTVRLSVLAHQSNAPFTHLGASCDRYIFGVLGQIASAENLSSF